MDKRNINDKKTNKDIDKYKNEFEKQKDKAVWAAIDKTMSKYKIFKKVK